MHLSPRGSRKNMVLAQGWQIGLLASWLLSGISWISFSAFLFLHKRELNIYLSQLLQGLNKAVSAKFLAQS